MPEKLYCRDSRDGCKFCAPLRFDSNIPVMPAFVATCTAHGDVLMKWCGCCTDWHEYSLTADGTVVRCPNGNNTCPTCSEFRLERIGDLPKRACRMHVIGGVYNCGYSPVEVNTLQEQAQRILKRVAHGMAEQKAKQIQIRDEAEKQQRLVDEFKQTCEHVFKDNDNHDDD